MQNETHLRILAINPGSRYLGTAFFIDSELREWRLKVVGVKGKVQKQEKTIRILSELMNRHQPNVLSIKALHPSRCSPNLMILVNKIKRFSQKNRLPVFTYSIRDLEEFFLSGKRKNKRELARCLANQYRALLTNDFEQEEQNRNPYFIRVFEAVALGLICYAVRHPV